MKRAQELLGELSNARDKSAVDAIFLEAYKNKNLEELLKEYQNNQAQYHLSEELKERIGNKW